LVLLALGALVDCAPMPLPRMGRPVFSETPELIPYRPLTRDDFKARVASGFTRAEEEQIQAMTCTQIIVRPRDVVTRAIHSASGAKSYLARLDDPLFFAAMNRTCSWWRPDGVLPDEQVLEHEQIHFAIEELQARRLNARALDIARRIETQGSNLGSVSQRAQGELRSILEEAAKASLERSTVFDLQSRDRVRQRQWFHKVMAELEATRTYARGPQTSFVAELDPLPSAPVPVPSAPPAPAVSPEPAASAPPPPKVLAPSPPPSSPGSSATFPD
jgi:hypothetical protein